MNSKDVFMDLLGPSPERSFKQREQIITRPETIEEIDNTEEEPSEVETLKTQVEAFEMAAEELAKEKLESKEKEESLIRELELARCEKFKAEATAIMSLISLAAAKMKYTLEQEKNEKKTFIDEQVKEALARAEKAEKDAQRLRKLNRDLSDNIERFEMMDSSSLSVLLDKPEGVSEKFVSEIREHVLEAISEGQKTAERSGRDRAARLLEAVLGANVSTGYLARYRSKMRSVINKSTTALDQETISEFTRMGFNHAEGKDAHKFDWGGIKSSVPKVNADLIAYKSTLVELMKKTF